MQKKVDREQREHIAKVKRDEEMVRTLDEQMALLKVKHAEALQLKREEAEIVV